jgi:hypothetical protein
MPQIVGGLADVKEKVAGKPVPAQKQTVQKIASEYTKVQEIGGLLGRFLLAMLAVRIVSRRRLLRLFQWPGLIVMPLIFWFFLSVENREFFTLNLESVYLGHLPITTMSLAVGICGLFTVAQFSFWGNYLPRVYPMHLRGTGESVAANIGGRMIGTSFAAVTSYMATLSVIPGEPGPERVTHSAALVALLVYLAGSILTFFLPEPSSEALDNE